MRSNVLIDDELITKAQTINGGHSKSATINRALSEYVEAHSRKDLRELSGAVEFFKDYDYKKLRG